MPAFNRIERTCEVCGQTFLAKPSQVNKGCARFCSITCAALRPRESTRVQCVCAACGKEFTVKRYEAARGDGRYCSLACYHGDKAESLELRFLRSVSEPTPTGCILWTGHTRNGYGILQGTVDGRHVSMQAHRFAWERIHGPIPPGMHALHTCDVRSCCNAAHVFIGTHAENMADKARKGRQRRGDTHPRSTLTSEAVRDIRTRYVAGGVTQVQLAAEYGVTPMTILNVVSGRTWGHAPGPIRVPETHAPAVDGPAEAVGTGAGASRRAPIERACEHCGQTFFVWPRDLRRGGGKFCSRACHYVGRREPLEARFVRHVGPITEHGCILWTGTLNTAGYGVLTVRPRRLVMAHRVAWEIANGPIPEGIQVLHACDKFFPPGDIGYRRCVNPCHLHLGGPQQNSADKVAAGRHRRGETSNLSKLSAEDVRAIRARYAAGGVSQVRLAAEYGTTNTNISQIVNGHSWKDLDA
jgi:hypothetical protein